MPGWWEYTHHHQYSLVVIFWILHNQCLPLHRVGLMGNPSDGFNGKTIAMTISNFWAEVTLIESQSLVDKTLYYVNPYQKTRSAFFLNSFNTVFVCRSSFLIHWMIPLSSAAYRICFASATKKGLFFFFSVILPVSVCYMCSQYILYEIIRKQHYLMFPLARYLGGLRLLQATCKKFYQFCSNQG